MHPINRHPRYRKYGLISLLCLLSNMALSVVWAESTGDTNKVQASEYSKKGADTCLKCHNETSEFAVLSIFKTKHAALADARTPFAGLQCEACHGPGAEHSRKVGSGEQRQLIINFGEKSLLSTKAQNQVCLVCHNKRGRIFWQSSSHEGQGVVCVNCHRIHVPQDPVLTRLTQPEICFVCHQQARAEFFKPSSHLMRFGKLGCSDCHRAHGAISEALLSMPTLNETCFRCHAQMRGPYLWEHAPAAEDCRLCHLPHGSIHPALLVKRLPLLCQQCHSQAGHPSLALDGSGLADGNPSALLLAGGCINCHAQVHGSNHPSGAKLMR